MDNGMIFQAYFFLLQDFFFLSLSSRPMTFMVQMNNKRDTMFWNIKINRVIIPTRAARTRTGYRDLEAFSREQRLYKPNRVGLTAKIT